MQQRDVVVIGGSAGSWKPLREILAALPASFPASVFVVVHISADSDGSLEEHFSRLASLPVTQAMDCEPIRRGHVYVARPDYHLTLEPGRMRVLREPRENRHRPAIDPLFRTAARVYGARVIGIILSGLLDDGSAGLYAVKQRGGIAMVQDPTEAAFPEMPRSALNYATPHYVLRTAEIVANLINLVHIDQDEIVMPSRHTGKAASASGKASPSLSGAQPARNMETAYFDEGEGTPSVFACPDCHGVLWELKNGGLLRFRCRVGHSWGSESLAKELSQASESALWAAVRALGGKSRHAAPNRRYHVRQSKVGQPSARSILGR